jgi:hypothetical protein
MQQVDLRIEKILEKIVLFLIVVKIIFAITAVGDILIKYFFDTNVNADMLDQKFLYWKHLTEFVFVVSMSLLLIFIFNPWRKHQIYITKEMSILFYLFGYILLFTADWDTLGKMPPWFAQIKSSLKFNT